MKTFTFDKLPESVAELQAMPGAALSDPFKGPRPLSPFEKQFLRDRLVGKSYVPRSYFAGTSPENNYEPTLPYTITVEENPYSYQNEGYATLWIKSSGADTPRQVQMRHAKDGRWYLWENFLLPDIRIPASEDPWA